MGAWSRRTVVFSPDFSLLTRKTQVVVARRLAVPVATVGIGNFGAINAALLAVQIIAVSDDAMAKKLDQYKADMAKKVLAKDQAVQADWSKKLSGG